MRKTSTVRLAGDSSAAAVPHTAPHSWPYRPVLLVAPVSTPDGKKNAVNQGDENPACPIGQPFEFESDLFKGRLLLRVRDLAVSDDAPRGESYFHGKKRLFQYIIQGRFKKAVKASDLWFGSEYRKPLKTKPPKLLMHPIQALLQKKCPGIELDVLSDRPKVMSIFPAGVQTIRVDETGQEPDIASFFIREKNSPFGNHFAESSKSVSSVKRKKLFSNAKVASEYEFDTEHIFTFDHYDDIFDLARFELKLSNIFCCDLAKVIEEPFQILAKNKNGDGYLWYFELWHEKLVRAGGA